MKRICRVKDCNNKILAKGLCSAHYQRMWKYGRYERLLKITGIKPKDQKTYHRLYSRMRDRLSNRKEYLRNYHKSAKYKMIHRFASAKYIKNNPQKQKARELAEKFIEKKNYCEICGTNNTHLHLHHPNYTKPLMTITLCQACHKKIHYYADT